MTRQIPPHPPVKKGGAGSGQDRLVRPAEAAARLGLSRSSVYRWFWEGKLSGVKLGGGPVRIFESAIVEQLQTNECFFD